MIHVSKLYIVVQILTNPIYYPKYRTQFIQPPSPSLKSIIKSNERNKREQELENQSSKIERGEQLLSEQNLRKRENRATFQIAKLNNANDRFDLFEGQRFPFYHSSLPPPSLSPSLTSPPSFLRGGGQRPVCWALQVSQRVPLQPCGRMKRGL